MVIDPQLGDTAQKARARPGYRPPGVAPFLHHASEDTPGFGRPKLPRSDHRKTGGVGLSTGAIWTLARWCPVRRLAHSCNLDLSEAKLDLAEVEFGLWRA